MPDLVWIEPKWSLCSHKSPSHSLQQSEEDRQNHKFWNLMWNNSILCKTVLTSEEKRMFMFLLIVRLWLWKQVFKLFQLTRTSHHPVLHYHHVSRCKSYMLRQYGLGYHWNSEHFLAILTRPSVTHQSLLSLIKAVTGRQVPGVFSHISTPSNIFAQRCMQKAHSRWAARANGKTKSSSRPVFSTMESSRTASSFSASLSHSKTKDSARLPSRLLA